MLILRHMFYHKKYRQLRIVLTTVNNKMLCKKQIDEYLNDVIIIFVYS